MTSTHHRRDDCRLCGSRDVTLVVPLAPTPIADAYVTHEELDQPQEAYPLDLFLCRACGHVQLLDVVRPDLMFRPDYTYLSGSSAGIVKHFGEYARDLLQREQPPAGSLVVDIGSNDGTFLRFFAEAGHQVLGVDPAAKVARRATEAGIETWPAFFVPEVARRIRAERGPARIVSANNVFAHADDLGAVADAVRELLADDGVFTFEVSYLADVVDKMLLGTIFHEHLCYHSVRPLRSFLLRHGLELTDVQRVSIQGGSIICTAQHVAGPRPIAPAVDELARAEEASGLGREGALRAFSARIEAVKKDLAAVLDELDRRGGVLAGFGAARGGTILIRHFDLARRLAFIVDDAADKQGLYSPGDHIPILPASALAERKPDAVFILAWVHTKAILQKQRPYLDAGGRFIVVDPNVRVVQGAAHG